MWKKGNEEEIKWDHLYCKLRDWKQEYKDIKDYTLNISKEELNILIERIEYYNREISLYSSVIENIVYILEDEGMIDD